MADLIITFDESFSEPDRTEFRSIATEVYGIVIELFGGPPFFDLPIKCYKRSQGPITALDNWFNPTCVAIGISAEKRRWAQLVYQLGHEFAHVMLDPRRTNGIIETLCVAMSHDALHRMADQWAGSPCAWKRTYSSSFREYLQQVEDESLDRLSMRERIRQGGWQAAREYLMLHRDEQEQVSIAEINDVRGRDIQTLGAIALRSAGVIPWNRLIGLAVRCSAIPVSANDDCEWRVAAFVPDASLSASGILWPIGR